jgi:hypothetical protein
MAYRPGEIAIAPFSHTDPTEGKNRPVPSCSLRDSPTTMTTGLVA